MKTFILCLLLISALAITTKQSSQAKTKLNDKDIYLSPLNQQPISKYIIVKNGVNTFLSSSNDRARSSLEVLLIKNEKSKKDILML